MSDSLDNLKKLNAMMKKKPKENNDWYTILEGFGKLATKPPSKVTEESHKHLSPDAQKIMQQVASQEQEKRRNKK